MLGPIRVLVTLAHNLVSTNLWPDFRPGNPVRNTEQQNTYTHDREDVVRVSLSIPVTVRRYKWYQSKEDVGCKIKDRDWKPGLPW